jgi:hypothetical protein
MFLSITADLFDVLSGPICASITCSKDKIPGQYLKDLKSRTLNECFDEAIEHCNKYKLNGDKIVLLSTTKKIMYRSDITKEQEENMFIFKWVKVNDNWIKG